MLKSLVSAKWPAHLSLVFAILMFAMAVIGIWVNFSTVPFWDMWDGTLGFILSIKEGNYQEWWGQHNEHRIILSRGLFYLDYAYFGGVSRFLIPLNIVIVCGAAVTFWMFAQKLGRQSHDVKNTVAIVTLLISGFIFSWIQAENFTWGFQSQFLLAQMMPLLSLYFIARASEKDGIYHFWSAMVLGILSAGTMANGILILPIIFVFLLIIWQGTARAIIILCLAILVPSLYLFDYSPVARHGSISDALQHDPLGLIKYTLMYIGSPFFHFADGYEHARDLSVLAGLLLFVFCVRMAYQQIRAKHRSPYVVALLCFILYIGGTALGTAGGRLSLGITGATSSRYATPALMAWAAFTLAMIVSFPKPSQYLRNILWGGTVLLCVLGFVYQFKSLERQDEKLFGRELAVLALEMQVRDEHAIGTVFPSVDYALSIATQATDIGTSVFDAYPFHGIAEAQGQMIDVINAPACIGSLDEEIIVDGSKNHLRLRGWIFDPVSKRSPKLITFTNEDGVIIGSGLSGQPRPDVRKAIHSKAFTAGFGGYINNDAEQNVIFGYGDDPVCRIEFSRRNQIEP